MNRSPGPTPLLAVEHQQRDVGVGELLLDAPGHARGERVAGSLHARQVDEHHLAVAARAHAADRPPRGLRTIGDDRHLLSDDRVDERRLAHVRPAGQRHEAAARQRLSRASNSALQRQHLAVVGLVVHADQMQHAVHDRLADVHGVLRADHHVAQLPQRLERIGAVDREGQHVGRLRLSSVAGVELGDPPGIHELDREMALLNSGRAGRQSAQAPHLIERRQVLPLRRGSRGAPGRAAAPPKTSTSIIGDQARRSADLSSGASRWACTS